MRRKHKSGIRRASTTAGESTTDVRPQMSMRMDYLSKERATPNSNPNLAPPTLQVRGKGIALSDKELADFDLVKETQSGKATNNLANM